MTVENTKAEDQAEQPEANETEISADAEAAVDPIMEEAADSEDQAEEQANDDSAKRIEELEEQLAQAKDQALRAHAEAMNTKRRAEQDVEKAHKFALEKFVNELIPVVESLEKGIESAEQGEGQHETMLEGMRLTLKQLLDALAKFNVEQVNPEGQPFDPNFHQAISMVPNPDMEPNTVMNVFQKGYTLHGRVIRPAMVVVSKAA
ncbi:MULTISPECIES: nucleotide exchange factor GrpE [Gammaproteobacteria]|uniref:nucleotide exchange factor GrpE n=1 Tax=Gammaproteobacteria TaxID=1236 RepID=UPI001AD99664|nr:MULTISPECIES: nucleotide exchange factor GrpE [Gammaproteobacteria]MBO9481656.1 nucleotide exchange factor GrpE [Salinisphaera sp. G21_0]MBO9493178.1 nucleotide exchange factor GrpE [Thalassotalea sp. G20_0]